MVARVLRIFPGLLVMLLFSVFVIGLSFTTLSWQATHRIRNLQVLLPSA
jgi:peptidoglycan/LPS O-acetylase OafA/YrhL